MSYIIASVTFPESSQVFPVECFRTDLNAGDKVIVRRKDGKLRHATIIRLEYLNWDAKARIECRLSEASVNDDDLITIPKGCPIRIGIATQDDLIKELRRKGWARLKPSKMHLRMVFARSNNRFEAYIFFRKNSIDIRIYPIDIKREIKPFSEYSRPKTKGQSVTHYLSHNTFNLLEGVYRFARSFDNNENNLDRFFVPQGSKDKRTNELREQSELRKTEQLERRRMDDYYNVDDDLTYPDDMICGWHAK